MRSRKGFGCGSEVAAGIGGCVRFRGWAVGSEVEWPGGWADMKCGSGLKFMI
jgi:hypothetical protein